MEVTVRHTEPKDFIGVQALYTNQYKDVIAQREFSASEARQRVKNIVVLRSSSLTQHQMR